MKAAFSILLLGLVTGCRSLRFGSEGLLVQNEAQKELIFNGAEDAQFEHFAHSTVPDYQLRLKSPKLCDPKVKQYSGYLDVSKDKHLFFWFFEARNNPSTAPIVIWLNGGPGCSSTTGLFFALGPCSIGEDGKNTTVNEWSWNTNANLLFIDQPAGVGYSYNTGSTVDNSFVAADDMWAFMQLFYKRFGHYSRELHVAGESYAGTYVPHIAKAVWEKSKRAKKEDGLEKIELASILIGNGLTHPHYQLGVMHEWLCDGKWNVFPKDSPACQKLLRDVATCQRLVKSCDDYDTDLVCGTAASFCFENILGAPSRSGLNPYDARMKCSEGESSVGCYPSSGWIKSYLNRPDIKHELGGAANVLFDNCNENVHQSFVRSGDAARNSAVLLPEMIEDGVRMLIYVGDADLLCPGTGQIPWLEHLNTTLRDSFRSSPRTDFRTHNRAAGFVRDTGAEKNAKRITYVEIFEAGHMAPHDQPDAALDMFNRWIWNKPMAHGKITQDARKPAVGMMLSSPSRPASIAASSRAYTPGPISPGPAALASIGNVRITYTLAQTLQSSPHFAVLLDSLRSRVQPLRNLHWRPSAGTLPSSSIRTIQYLDAELAPLDLGTSSARLSTVDGLTGGGVGEGRSQIPGTVLAKPFINLWLGMCEDADAYKNVVRRQLKEWVASVTTQSRRDQEWLIVLVNISTPGQDAAGSGGKRLFQMKGSVIDRMRADFTLAKRDRCVQLNYIAGGQDDPAAWTELIAKIKDSIVTTLDERIAERIDDVRRMEAQRAVPGWNFCTFFVLKETIAESFEGMTLLDAALLQYSELEASFYQVLKEKNLSWFGKLGGTTPGDDAAPLLSVTKKPYRDLILSNTISVFDFRCYLLARQCLLLARMGAIADAAYKATDFITTFARTLRENENSLSEPFLESWMYSCALNVVDECDGWVAGASGQESISDAKGSGYSAAKCELLELARAQLDKIGIRAGHLPRISPFSTSLPEQPPKSRPSSSTYEPYLAVAGTNAEDHRRLSRLGVSNPDILEAIDDPTSFDNLYKRIVMRTIDTCRSSGRTRTETKLRGVLAALHLHRGQLPDAHTIYADLPPIYAEQHWTILESYMRTQSLATSEALEEVHNERWVHRALALVKADLALPIQARPESVTSRIQQTLNDILLAADKLPKDLLIDNFSPLDIRPASNVARLDDTQDGSFFDVVANNTLPVTIDAKFIRIKLRGQDGVDAIFAHSETQLPPGESALSLFCPDPISGLFTTSTFEYQLSNLLFQSSPPESSSPTSTTKGSLSETRSTLRVPQDTQAAQVLMQMPRHVVLGDQRVLFKILTRRNTLRSGELSVTSQGSQVGYALESAKVLSEDCGSVRCTKDHIILEDLPGNHELVLSLPFSGSPRNDELEATISLAYTTISQPEVTRNVKLRWKEYVGLPLIVNINDKFRGQRLFTNVVIHSANQELLRIAKVTLSSGPAQSKLAIKSCRRSPESVTVRPARPAPFLFQIQASNADEPPTGETLQLKITYRSLYEDLRTVIDRAVELAGDHPTSQRKRKEARETAKEALLNDSSWVDMLELIYRSSEKTDNLTWAKQLVDHAPIKLDLDSISDAIKEMKDTDHNSQLETFDEQSKWRTVTMPFDVPLVNIINRARITPQISPDALVYAGQPLDVAVTIESCFHWSGSREDSGAKYLMRYDVLSDMDSGWLISGPKRGEYLAQDQGMHTLNITLLPLRHGVLSLPIVTAEPADDSGGRRPSFETWQSDGAQKITVLPRTSRSTYTIVMPIPVM